MAAAAEEAELVLHKEPGIRVRGGGGRGGRGGRRCLRGRNKLVHFCLQILKKCYIKIGGEGREYQLRGGIEELDVKAKMIYSPKEYPNYTFKNQLFDALGPVDLMEVKIQLSNCETKIRLHNVHSTFSKYIAKQRILKCKMWKVMMSPDMIFTSKQLIYNTIIAKTQMQYFQISHGDRCPRTIYKEIHENKKSARGYTSAKTVWGFGVIPMDPVSQRQILLVFEARDLNVERYMKVAAAVQNAIQCYRVIYDEKQKLLPRHHWIVFSRGQNELLFYILMNKEREREREREEEREEETGEKKKNENKEEEEEKQKEVGRKGEGASGGEGEEEEGQEGRRSILKIPNEHKADKHTGRACTRKTPHEQNRPGRPNQNRDESPHGTRITGNNHKNPNKQKVKQLHSLVEKQNYENYVQQYYLMVPSLSLNEALLDDIVYPHVYYTFPVKTELLRQDLLLLVCRYSKNGFDFLPLPDTEYVTDILIDLAKDRAFGQEDIDKPLPL
eukprot:bmy_09078T0